VHALCHSRDLIGFQFVDVNSVTGDPSFPNSAVISLPSRADPDCIQTQDGA